MITGKNGFIPEGPPADTMKWIGRLLLTVVAGIILAKFGVHLPDNMKL